MGSRNALSIGDVLTLLRVEFPDVTISKIRFLESQGLVNPERTQSGYRKFYSDDVARLRWILRQQREHFLPLKVIRDRLAESNGLLPDEDMTPEVQAASLPTTPVTVSTAEVLGEGYSDAVMREIYDDSAFDEVRELAHRAQASDAVVADFVARPVPSRRPTQAVAADAWRSAAAVVHTTVDSYATTSEEYPEPPVAPPAFVAPTAPVFRPAQKERPIPAATQKPLVGLGLSDFSAESGLSLQEIAALKEYSLVTPSTVGGIESFDDDDLEVAKLAVAFREFGIEPRHLRAFRYAVDREFGLIETVILPLLRRRSVEGHAQARQVADEMVELGFALRKTLLKEALRRHLGD